MPRDTRASPTRKLIRRKAQKPLESPVQKQGYPKPSLLHARIFGIPWFVLCWLATLCADNVLYGYPPWWPSVGKNKRPCGSPEILVEARARPLAAMTHLSLGTSCKGNRLLSAEVGEVKNQKQGLGEPSFVKTVLMRSSNSSSSISPLPSTSYSAWVGRTSSRRFGGGGGVGGFRGGGGG